MGQRYDLVFKMPASGQVRVLDERRQTGSAVPVREWVRVGAGDLPQLSDPVESLPTFDLTTYGTPAPDPLLQPSSFDIDRELRISNTPGFRDGRFEEIHRLNGKPSPDSDPVIVREGQAVRLRLVNDTDEFHPMHLHGHIFSVLSKNGEPIQGSPVRLDTVLLGPHETSEIAFVADNPGLWMIHCHVLVHVAYGLSSMVSYAGISTPYEIGTRSGNFPE
jgi:FtsP/CotA-like multicopper oxidase with cupredoxin domain